jgi:hypothetical protein
MDLKGIIALTGLIIAISYGILYAIVVNMHLLNIQMAGIRLAMLFVLFLIISYLYLFSFQYVGILLIILAFLLLVIIASKILNHVEYFGMSPGTLDQLQSTHVPTRSNFETQLALQKEAEKSSIELTGSL